MSWSRVRDSVGYVTGFLRHTFMLGNIKTYENIFEQYSRDELDRRTAKKRLLFAGFFPLPLADAYLKIADCSKRI